MAKLGVQYLNIWSVVSFLIIPWVFWITSFSDQKVTQNHDSQRNFDENMSYYLVNTVPADVLAPTDARAWAGTVMTKFMYSW